MRPAIPLGQYTISVASPGFVQTSQAVIVNSGSGPVLHVPLSVAGAHETVTVSGRARRSCADQFGHAPTTLVNRLDIDQQDKAIRN